MCCVGNCGDCCVGNCSHCGGKAEAELKARHEKKVAEELAKHRKELNETSDKFEKNLIRSLNSSIDDLVKTIEDYNQKVFGNRKLDINIAKIRAEQEKLKKEVIGFVANNTNKRMVQTDPELSLILAEKDDNVRNKRFAEFTEKIYAFALTQLKTKIRPFIQAEEDIVKSEIEKRINEVEVSMAKAKDEYQTILSINDNDSAKLEEVKIKYMYNLDLYKILIKQVEGIGQTK